MSRPLLTARWTNVVLVTYRVPAVLLRPAVPPESELDTPDGQPDLHLLSLVALHFTHTRVCGVPVPTAQSFPEVNLRFYVRRGHIRAAVFLREFVPVPLVVLGARLLYHQPYHLARIKHTIQVEDQSIHAHTHLRSGQHAGTIHLRARNELVTPPPDSEAHFLKEHYWGIDRTPAGRSFRYRVTHPVWRTYPVETAHVTIDPGVLLGGAWQDIDWQAARHSVLFAEGSAAAVYAPEPLMSRSSGPARIPIPMPIHRTPTNGGQT